jgi:hypothetical protein
LNQWTSLNDKNQVQNHASNQEELSQQELEYIQAHEVKAENVASLEGDTSISEYEEKFIVLTLDFHTL